MDKYSREEQQKIRRKRLRDIMKTRDIKQPDIYKNDRLNISQSSLNQMLNGNRTITDETIREIQSEIFPDISLAYLFGDSDYMTISEQLNEAMSKCASETQLLNPSVINLLRLSGYNVKCYYEDGVTKSGSVKKMLDEINNYCTISKDGKTKVLDINQFNKLANLICDYTDFVAQTTL